MLPKTVALVTSSTRNPRLNPFITTYVRALLTPALPADVSLYVLERR